MKKGKITILVIAGLVVLGAILWQTGAVNYFLARTFLAPDFEEGLLDDEDPAENGDETAAENGDAVEDDEDDSDEAYEPVSTVDLEYGVEVLAENLEIPWEILHLPDGRILVTERLEE